MSDWYLEDRARLTGQPKRSIAEYVESHGILVPRRYSNSAEAMDSGQPVIARTEHPQDYDGASGLLHSKTFARGQQIPDEQQIIRELLKEGDVQSLYFTLNGTPERSNEFSISFWEYIPGYNRTIVADSAVPNRYHITTTSGLTTPEGFTCCHNYSLVENGTVVMSAVQDLVPQLQERLSQLLETYERIRHLEHFNSTHCPLMEFQSTYSTDYFLQYLRTRDFQPATFELDPNEPSDYPVVFVRGATPATGLELDVTLLHAYNYSENLCERPWSEWPMPDIEEGALDAHCNWAYTKTMIPQRKLQLIAAIQGRDWGLFKLIVGHEMRETMYRPLVSLMLPKDAILENFDALRDKCNETNQDVKVRLKVISDGKSAVLRKIEQQ